MGEMKEKVGVQKCLLEKWHKFPVIDKQSYYKKLSVKRVLKLVNF